MEMSGLLQIINQPHPLIASAAREFSRQDWRPGETARAALLRAGLDPHREITIVVGDRVLTVDEWDSVCPRPGDLVHAVAAVSGGGGGSNPLKIVLSLAVMVAAFYAGPIAGAYLGGFDSVAAMGVAGATGAFGLSGAAWGAIGAGLITIGGNIVVGAIFKPSTAALSQVNGSSAATSPTYSLSGGSNSLRAYGPMQVVMGTHRVFPDYGAKPYTEFHGSDQYLYQIFHFGLFAGQITDLRIGDSPIGNYSDVTMYWSGADGTLPQFPGNVDSESGGSLVRGADWLVRTTAPDTVRIAIDVEGSAYYSGDSGLVSCTARIEAQYAPAGSSAWQSFMTTAVSYTTGYWSLQTTEIDDSGATITVQHAYASTGHSEGETQQINIDGPSFSSVSATWHWAPFYTDAAYGGTTPTGLANDGPQPIYSTVGYLDIPHGASQTPQRRTLSLDVSKGVYDVRVRLTSVSSTLGEIASGDARGGYSYAFQTLRSYQEDATVFPGQNRMGMVIKATGQLSGVVQRLSALASAYANVYVSGVWRWKPTSNPAWWFIDFAHGRKSDSGVQLYGCHLDYSQIDVDAIIAWAAFCDDEGLSCNLVIDSQQAASDTLSDIARCGLGSPSWASGKLGVVWDRRNASPVAAFGMSNILRGSFSVRYATENLADEIVVSYIDPDKDWTQNQVRVTVPGVINPQSASTLEIKGCTNTSMAGKMANVQAAAQAYRRRTITWDADLEGFVCQRGDVVLLQHDLTQWGYSGRLMSVAGSVITLDRDVPRSGAVEYVLLVCPDGSQQTWAIAAATGTARTLTLPSAPVLQAGMLEIDHRWFFSPLPTPGKKVKIVSVKPVSQYRLQIVATDEDPAFYQAWDGDWREAATQTLLRNEVPTITGMTVAETPILTGIGVLGSRVTLTFAVSSPFDEIYLRYRMAGGPWVSETLRGDILIFDTDMKGAIEVEANAIKSLSAGPAFNGAGQVVGPATAVTGQSVVTTGDGQKAIVIVDANVVVSAEIAFDQQGYVRLVFRGISDPTIRLWEMRSGDAGFESGTLIAQTTDTFFSLPLASLIGKKLWIKALYLSGAYSAFTYAASFAGSTLPAITQITIKIIEPAIEFSWPPVAGADHYVCYFEEGGVTTVRTVTAPLAPFVIPKYSSTLRVYAVNTAGALSPPYDQAVSITGIYRLNELVNIALNVSSGQYVNLAFTNSNQVEKVSLLGPATFSTPIASSNSAGCYTFGYNLASTPGVNLQNTPGAWFRKNFWYDGNGFYESAPIDLGNVLSGRLKLNITKTVTPYGNGPGSAFAQVAGEYMALATGGELTDQKAFLSAQFYVCATLAGPWIEANDGDWVLSCRYVKIVIKAEQISPLTDCLITAGALTLDVPDITESATKTGVTSAGVAVSLTHVFNAVSLVLLTPKGNCKAWASNVLPGGFTINTDSVSPVDIGYFVKGY